MKKHEVLKLIGIILGLGEDHVVIPSELALVKTFLFDVRTAYSALDKNQLGEDHRVILPKTFRILRDRQNSLSCASSSVSSLSSLSSLGSL